MVRMPKSRLLLHWEELLELRLIHYEISMYFFRLMGMATLWWSWSQYTRRLPLAWAVLITVTGALSEQAIGVRP